MPTVFKAPTQKKNVPVTAKSPLRSQMHPLTCFVVNPSGVRFETQEENEQVILFLRQHLIVNIGWVILVVVMLTSPTVLFPFLLSAVNVSVHLPLGYILIGTVFWYLATFGFALANFISWFFNIYIITNERIVDIDFYYLLYKDFKEAELTKIQDLSYTTGGIIATLFNFGNVHIETAGEAPNLVFELIPYPEKVVETIRGLTGANEEERPL